MSIEKLQKSCTDFECNICAYYTSRKSSYNKHILTAKHINATKSIKSCKKLQQVYSCNKCGNQYKDSSGLWRHKQKASCEAETILDPTEEPFDYGEEFSDENIKAIVCKKDNTQELTGLIMTLIQQNKELTSQLIDIASSGKSVNNGTINNMNANTNNSHNKFNLNVFLNETCKDAMNMSDFIDSLQITVKDLEETGRLGYASGISRIFINGLKKLGEKFRPIHCSDLKRETLYIKNNNEWFKDTDDNEYITLAIKEITKKNIQQIFEWQKMHPEYNDPDSKVNDRYQHMLLNTMSGSSKEETNNNYSKIIRNLAKEVTISKQNKLN